MSDHRSSRSAAAEPVIAAPVMRLSRDAESRRPDRRRARSSGVNRRVCRSPPEAHELRAASPVHPNAPVIEAPALSLAAFTPFELTQQAYTAARVGIAVPAPAVLRRAAHDVVVAWTVTAAVEIPAI